MDKPEEAQELDDSWVEVDYAPLSGSVHEDNDVHILADPPTNAEPSSTEVVFLIPSSESLPVNPATSAVTTPVTTNNIWSQFFHKIEEFRAFLRQDDFSRDATASGLLQSDIVSQLETTLADTQLLLRTMTSHDASEPSGQEDRPQETQSTEDSTPHFPTISFLNFTIGDIALFMPASIDSLPQKQVWMAFNSGCANHSFLSRGFSTNLYAKKPKR